MPQKAKAQGPPCTLRSIALTPSDEEILQDLSQEATDTLGRAISGSAIVRALLRLAKQQKLSSQLIDLAEAELNSGTRWGKKR